MMSQWTIILFYLTIFSMTPCYLTGKYGWEHRGRDDRYLGLEMYPGVRVIDLVNASAKYLFNHSMEHALKRSVKKFISHSYLSMSNQSSSLIAHASTSTSFIPHAPHYRLLCATVVQANQRSFDLLTSNIINMSEGCRWAIFVYAGDMKLAADYEVQLKSMDLHGSIIVSYQYNISRLAIMEEYGIYPERFYDGFPSQSEAVRHAFESHHYNIFTFPKPIVLMLLIPILHDYSYVWLIDGDLDLKGFDLARLLTNLECAFDRPIIVGQPLIYENTQYYEYINYRGWQNHTGEILAAATGFIEMQTPIFHSLYFEWFLRNFVARMIWPLHILGVDNAFDTYYCKTAEYFMDELNEARMYEYIGQVAMNYHSNIEDSGREETIFRSRYLQQANSFRKPHRHQKIPPWLDRDRERLRTEVKNNICAVIINGSAVHHLDWRVLNANMNPETVKKTLSGEMENILLRYFYSFEMLGRHPRADPLDKNSRYAKSYMLKRDCPVVAVGSVTKASR
jgi:hypothetical protein